MFLFSITGENLVFNCQSGDKGFLFLLFHLLELAWSAVIPV